MAGNDINFFGNIIAPSLTENGHDVINAAELATELQTQNFLKENQTITVSGDATGTGSTSIALTLANSGVTPGTYNSVTVNAKGLITTGSVSSSTTTVTTITNNYNITTNDMVILANASLTATLPVITSVVTGKTYTIKKISNSGTVIITGASNIDGNTSVTLNQQYQSITITSDGSNWWII